MLLPKAFPVYILPYIVLFIFVMASLGYSYLSGLFQDSCDLLPGTDYAESVMAENSGIVSQIESLNPGNIWLELDSASCPGKAELLIYYATESDRQEIKNLIGDDFFGIPYKMFNV
jgi:hypothetical protein